MVSTVITAFSHSLNKSRPGEEAEIRLVPLVGTIHSAFNEEDYPLGLPHVPHPLLELDPEPALSFESSELLPSLPCVSNVVTISAHFTMWYVGPSLSSPTVNTLQETYHLMTSL